MEGIANWVCVGWIVEMGAVGMLGDKPVEGVTSLLAPLVDAWYVAGLAVDRGTEAEALVARMEGAAAASPVHTTASPVAAWQAACAAANPEDRVVAFGSFHTVGDILAHITCED